MMMARLMFVVIRPAFAVLLALGATLGVAASNIIMNLLVGYFAVATSAFTSVHPHIALHGKWTAEEARRQASLAKSLDRRIEAATPALHFERTITLATVKVITDLCEGGGTAEESCRQNRFLKNPTRTYAYEVTNQRRVEVQIRGITVDGGETTADIRKLMSGEPDLGRLAADKDSGGNELPIAFIAEDSLINDPTGSFLLAPHELAPTYPHYYRLHGLLRLGAMTSGSPMILLGLDQSRALAPSSLPPANVIEVRVSDVLEAERVADVLKGASAGQWTGVLTWVDKERPAFQFLNATWVMVFAVMLSICIVVAISIYSTLTLSVLRNQWKVALLGVIGLPPLRIAMLFVGFALAIATTGIAGGTLLGHHASLAIGGTLYANVLNVPYERFAQTVTLRPALWMALATIAIFLLSALLPAWRAVTIRPAVALRGQA